MEKNYTSYISLFQKIKEDNVVIVYNKQFSKHLFSQFLIFSEPIGSRTSILGKKFLSFSDLPLELYHQCALLNIDLPKLITDNEIILLITEILSSYNIPTKNFDLFKNILLAWKTLKLHDLSTDQYNNSFENRNILFFREVVDRLDQIMLKNSWIHKSQVFQYLIEKEYFQLDTNKKIKEVYLVGFPRLPKIFKDYLCHLFKNKINTKDWKNVLVNKKKETIILDSEKKQIEKLSQDLKKIFSEKKNPIIGIVLGSYPNKYKIYKLLKNLYNNRYLDHSIYYEYLYQVPIVAQLINILEIKETCNYYQLVNIIESTYIKGHTKHSYARNLIKEKIKIKCPKFFNIKEITSKEWFTKLLDEDLKVIFESCTEKKYTKINSVNFLRKIIVGIKVAGWPGEYKLTNFELNQLNNFYFILENLRIFSRSNTKLTFNDWLLFLQFMLKKKINSFDFLNHNIHILDVQETYGMSFEHLFIINIPSKVCTSNNHIDTYIPFELQKNELRSMENQINIEDLISQSINTKIISNIDNIHDDQNLSSSFVGKIPCKKINTHNIFFHKKNKMKDFIRKISPEEKMNNNINTLVIKNFSECPYKSAVIHRLGVKIIEKNKSFLSLSDRGKIIHKILESIWKIIRNSLHLENMTNIEIDIMIKENILKTLRSCHHYFAFIPEYIKQIEIRKIRELLSSWMEYEKKREQNFSVIALEKKFVVNISGFSISLRIDRIDLLDNMKRIVIDYKTSEKLNIRKIINHPETNPQLHIYSTYVKVQELFVAKINEKRSKLISISKEIEKKYCHLQSKSEADNQLKRKIEKILHQYGSGKIIAKPSIKNCKTCEISKVCNYSIGEY